jgi:hypothetical protein
MTARPTRRGKVEAREKESKQSAKEPYTAPLLTIHGSVEKITEGGGTSPGDGGAMSRIV